MSTFGERLREERVRLGMTQSDFAEAGGVQKRAQANYEANERSPDADYLAAVAATGADVLYMLTGRREVPPQQADASSPLNEPINFHLMARIFKMLSEIAQKAEKRLTEGAKLHMAVDVYNFVIQDQGVSGEAVKEERLERVLRLVVNN